MSNYTEWIPTIGIASIIIAIALLWIGLELHEIRESIKDRAARATRHREKIAANCQAAASDAMAPAAEIRKRAKDIRKRWAN